VKKSVALRVSAVAGALVVVEAAGALPASAAGLAPGDAGPRVRILQVRVAGWYPASVRKVHFALDGVYGEQTVLAVEAFQRHHGLPVDGLAGPITLAAIAELADRDTSTANFDFSEFEQNYNPACSAQANAYAGTLRGGKVSARRVKRNIRRLMWRLEALRAKGRGNSIGINSGFRSVAYNSCIGGAGLSQHMYGTAADNRMANVSNHRERVLARRTELHGIGCYSSLTHNHLDMRMDNGDNPAARAWWWPEVDKRGRDLDSNGRVCWGEPKRRRAAVTSAGDAAVVPTLAEIKAFAEAGEPRRLGAAD
jgi:zinc D-Ala-D-Ala carboxypeptidase